METCRQNGAGGAAGELPGKFEANGISPVPFKGVVLDRQVYGNIAVRAIRHLDILILPKEFTRAYRLMAQEGFLPLGPSLEESSGLIPIGQKPVRRLLQTAFFPSRDPVASRNNLPLDSSRVRWSYLKRPFQIIARVLRELI